MSKEATHQTLIASRRSTTLVGAPLVIAILLALFSLSPALAQEPVTYHFGVAPQNTNVTFESETDFETILGSTRALSGEVAVDFEAGKARARLEVPVDSLRTGIDLRDEHLRSRKWLDARKHPAISFTSTSARRLDDERWEVTGTFSMHGQSKEVTTVANVRRIPESVARKAGLDKGDWIRVTAPFELRLSDFGVEIPKGPARRVNDTWKVRVQAFASTRK